MTRKQAFLLTIGTAGALVLLGGFALRPSTDLSFLDKYSPLKGRSDRYIPKSYFFTRENGFRVFTQKGRFERTVQDMERHLPLWSEKRVDNAVIFTGDGETIIVRKGRSMNLPDPFYQYHGEPIYGRFVVDAQHAAKFKVNPAEVEGWISIDHEWMRRSGWLDDLIHGPRGSGPVPVNAASKPRP